jgi:butyryl-CoA dehydrogenase
LLQSELKKFAGQVLADRAAALDKSCSFPYDNVKRLAQMGIVGAMIPETYGGAALDTIGFAVVLEEISKACASTAFVIASHNVFFAFPILKFGTDEMRRKYLPKAARGEIIGGYALPRTNEFSTVPQSDRPCVNGKNPFVLNATANGPIITFIPDAHSNDYTAYVLDHGTPGIRFSKLSNTIGLRSAGIGEYVFENCCPAAMNIIGERQRGQKILESTHALARVLLAAISLGIAQGAADAAVKYAKERIQFQQPIIDFGMVREQVAEMSVNIEAARNLVYEAAVRIDRGEEYRSAAAMAKLFAGQSATAATLATIQIYGGYGYMKDYPAERYFRDAHMLNVICSTPDEDKELIVKGMVE